MQRASNRSATLSVEIGFRPFFSALTSLRGIETLRKNLDRSGESLTWGGLEGMEEVRRGKIEVIGGIVVEKWEKIRIHQNFLSNCIRGQSCVCCVVLKGYSGSNPQFSICKRWIVLI